MADAQAAIDAFRHVYNTDRPHQGIGMAFPADRFRPNTAEVLPLKPPPSLAAGTDAIPDVPVVVAAPVPPVALPIGLAVEVDRVAPASGNMTISGHQFWLGPLLAGQEVTMWAGHHRGPPDPWRRRPAQECPVAVHPYPVATAAVRW